MWLALLVDTPEQVAASLDAGWAAEGRRHVPPVCNAVMLSTHGRGEAMLESDAGRSRAG